jgi:glycosyltransferase involved in cell wall biosynthesis
MIGRTQARAFIVIPSFNEGIALRRTVDSLLPHGYQIVVVDDGSQVPASEVLAGLPVHYLRHFTNLGQGAALETGTEYAVSRNADVIIHFDADGQHDPSCLSDLIRPILAGECDVVLGSRFLDPRHIASVPFRRRMVLRAGIVISWLFTGVWLTDTHNGLRALSGAAARKVRMKEAGFAHATEILALIKKAKLRYREFPTLVRYTEESLAKGQTGWNGVNILFDLMVSRVLR